MQTRSDLVATAWALQEAMGVVRGPMVRGHELLRAVLRWICRAAPCLLPVLSGAPHRAAPLCSFWDQLLLVPEHQAEAGVLGHTWKAFGKRCPQEGQTPAQAGGLNCQDWEIGPELPGLGNWSPGEYFYFLFCSVNRHQEMEPALPVYNEKRNSFLLPVRLAAALSVVTLVSSLTWLNFWI